MKSSLTVSSRRPFATSHRTGDRPQTVGARSLRANLDACGRFKSAAHLRGDFYALIGAFQPSQVVHMLGSGVTVCHNLLAMEAAGRSARGLFAPSWRGWIRDLTHAVVRV